MEPSGPKRLWGAKISVLPAKHGFPRCTPNFGTPHPNQQPQHSREGEVGERKEHGPMLSPPDASDSKGDRFGLGRQPIGCEAQHDLVFARA